jgi:hypothetical protein
MRNIAGALPTEIAILRTSSAAARAEILWAAARTMRGVIKLKAEAGNRAAPVTAVRETGVE